MRLPDWRKRLAHFITERRTTPHVWGSSDCSLFAADGALAMTARDFAADLRGAYAGAYSALMALKRLGFVSVVDFIDARLMRTDRPQEGDVVAMSRGRLPVLGIADGRGSAWAQDGAGLVRIAIPAGSIAWSV